MSAASTTLRNAPRSTRKCWPRDFRADIRDVSRVEVSVITPALPASLSRPSCREAVHPPLICNPGHILPGDSSQESLEHPKSSAYRCFLPDLTGFTVLRRPGPSSLHPPVKTEVLDTDRGREFHPAVAGCGYRAPLAPRVARPRLYPRAGVPYCQLEGRAGGVRQGDERRYGGPKPSSISSPSLGT